MDFEREIRSIHIFYKLKEVERYKGVEKESSAEHTYSCILLAQYFLPKIGEKLDEMKVMKMLLYHDVVEIEAGDTYFADCDGLLCKEKNENEALCKLKCMLPEDICCDFEMFWKEFEANETREAKFCNAIDKLDPYFQVLFKPEVLHKLNVTEKVLRDSKEEYFREFDVIFEFYEKFTEYFRENGYFGE